METPQDNQPEKMDTFPVSPVKESIFEQINAPHQEIRKSTTPDFVPVSPCSKCTPDEKVKSCKGDSTDEEEANTSCELSDEVRNFLSSIIYLCKDVKTKTFCPLGSTPSPRRFSSKAVKTKTFCPLGSTPSP